MHRKPAVSDNAAQAFQPARLAAWGGINQETDIPGRRIS